jgi:hypothetical protein
MIRRKSVFMLILLMSAVLFSCENSSQKTENNEGAKLSDEQVLDIAQEAYFFGYAPLLRKYTYLKQTSVAEPNHFGMAPVNQISHFITFPDAGYKDIVKPNVDTYYSLAWMDVTNEPVVMTVPAINRFYLIPFYDAYTNVFQVVGTRTTGSDAHNLLITGPEWTGEVPEGMLEVKSPHNLVAIIARIKVDSEKDGVKNVVPLQNQMNIIPLSKWGTEYVPPKGVANEENLKINPPVYVENMSIEQYFNELAQYIAEFPPAEADSTMIDNMKKIGLVAGQEWDINKFSPELQAKLREVPKKAFAKLRDMQQNPPADWIKNNWLYITSTGEYGTDYLNRAVVNFVGYGANLPLDAVYPFTFKDKDGQMFDGKNKYVLHFNKDQKPPLNEGGFWSLTMYNADEFLVDNPLNRYALRDRDPLNYNEDGSLDIYIQSNNPDGDKEANWLPSPKEGKFNLTLRLYYPKQPIIDRTYDIPQVEKVK